MRATDLLPSLPSLLGLALALTGCGGESVRGTASRAGRIGPFMDLRHADLAGHDLSERDLEHIRLDRATLTGTDLRDADLQGASLRWVDLSETLLGGADLRDADLRGSVWGANPGAVDLTGADMRGATVEGSDLSHATLDGTDWRGAFADDATKWPAEFGSPWAVGVQGADGP